MDRFKKIISQLLEMCTTYTDIKAVIAFGSQCRKHKKADEYSDLDLIIVCENPGEFLYKDERVNRLGEIEYSFIEDTFENQKARRILFKGSLDVDLIIIQTQVFHMVLDKHILDDFLKRGYQILYNKESFCDLQQKISVINHSENHIPSKMEFENLINDFYYHIVWAEKKILRGEIWTAKMCIDTYLKSRLLKMIEIYEVCVHGTEYDVWHSGRMLEQWAEEDIIQELKQCFAHYDAEELKKALENTKILFTRLAEVCAKKYGY